MKQVAEHEVDALSWTWSLNVKIESGQPGFDGEITYKDTFVTFDDAPTPAAGQVISNFMSRRADQVLASFDDDDVTISYLLDNEVEGTVKVTDAKINDLRAALADVVDDGEIQAIVPTDPDTGPPPEIVLPEIGLAANDLADAQGTASYAFSESLSAFDAYGWEFNPSAALDLAESLQTNVADFQEDAELPNDVATAGFVQDDWLI